MRCWSTETQWDSDWFRPASRCLSWPLWCHLTNYTINNTVWVSLYLYACVHSYSSAAQVVQTQFIGQFADPHGVWKILFVGKHQNNCFLQLILLDLHTGSCNWWHHRTTGSCDWRWGIQSWGKHLNCPFHHQQLAWFLTNRTSNSWAMATSWHSSSPASDSPSSRVPQQTLRLSLCRYCPLRRSGPEIEVRGCHSDLRGAPLLVLVGSSGFQMTLICVLPSNRVTDWDAVFRFCSLPVCSGSSVSTEVWSCPDHQRPKQWSKCSCTQLSPRWNLKHKRSQLWFDDAMIDTTDGNKCYLLLNWHQTEEW